MTKATLVVRCSKHPTYRGARKPTVDCTPCFTVRAYWVMRESVRIAQGAHDKLKEEQDDGTT